MNRFAQSRVFAALVYLILGLTALYLLMLVRPMLWSVYGFFKAVLAPFLFALVISYVLNPVVNLLHERKVPRTAAVLLIYAVFIACCTVILMNLIPMLIEQAEELNEHVPELTMRAQMLVEHYNHHVLLPDSVREGINRAVESLEKRFSTAVSDFLNNLDAVAGAVFLVMIVPFLAFYMMKDMDLFEKAALAYLPRSVRKQTVRLMKEIDQALGSYIRGQFLVSLAIGVLAYIGYWLIDLPYPLLMAGFVALFEIIPYLGPFLGALPALIVASTVSWKMVLLAAVVNMVCQTLESNVISPQVVGRSMKIHPLTIIFVLLVGGELAGVVGMVFAVPAYAALKVVTHHLLTYYIRRKTV